MLGLLVVAVVVYLAAFIYFSLRNPDALRSEKFTIAKMAMEKNMFGDDVAGLIEVSEEENVSDKLPDVLPEADPEK